MGPLKPLGYTFPLAAPRVDQLKVADARELEVVAAGRGGERAAVVDGYAVVRVAVDKEDGNAQRQPAHRVGVRGRICAGELHYGAAADTLAGCTLKVSDGRERDRRCNFARSGRPQRKVATGRVSNHDLPANPTKRSVNVGERVEDAGAAVLDVPGCPPAQREIDSERARVGAREGRTPEPSMQENGNPRSATPDVGDLIAVVAVRARLEPRLMLLSPRLKVSEEGLDVHRST